MAKSWWERQVYAAQSFAGRILEEAGVSDVVEEIARFDDDDMSAADYISTAGKALWQTAHQPIQGLATAATEVNRFIGADLRASRNGPSLWDMFSAEGRAKLASGEQMGTLYDWSAINDYFTGGLDEEERKKVEAERGLPAANAAYTPVSASDAYTIGVDKAVNRFGKGILWTPVGLPYAVGSFFNPNDGVQSNGSYLPASFDMWAQDAGQQVWERSQMTHQLIAGQVVVESAVDPLNFAAAPIAAGIAGVRAAKLGVAGKEVLDAVDSARYLDLVANTATETRQSMRFAQWVPGRGTWNPERMLQEMAYNPAQREMLDKVAKTTDVGTLRRWISDADMANGEGADAMASILAQLDTPEDVAAAFYSFAYRDKTATDRVLAALENKAGALPAANELRTMTGTGLNVLEDAVVKFGDGPLPEGHILTSSAQEFVNHAIDSAVARMGLPPEVPNPLREAWDALAKEGKDAITRDVQNYQAAMRGADWMLRNEDSIAAGARLQAMPVGGFGKRGVNALERAAGGADTRTAVRATNWLTNHLPAIKVNGRSTRTSASVWLMSRPGLTFSLHGLDAVERFDDVIHYVDGIIGGGFAADATTAALREEFIQAGALTRAPEQLRASLVNQLQAHALERIATNRGATTDAARVLAEAGMNRAEKMANALNSADTGYTTTIVEDGLPLILAGHPATIRQTANFIPLMDLKAVDDALKSKGLKAYTLDGAKLSETTVKAELAAIGGGTRKGLDRVGRNKVVRAVHDVTDIMDTVNTVFKASVLMRLGYPVRNLAEAHLSSFAAGVGWLDVVAAADLPTLMGNFLTNVRRTPQRMIDRAYTHWGLVKNEDALLATAQALEHATNQSADNLARLVRAATNEETITSLVRAVNAGDEAALGELQTLIKWRVDAAHQLESRLVEDGLLGEHARLSGTYYHADTAGNIDSLDNLDGPISVVDNAPVAQDAVDAVWSDEYWLNAGAPRGTFSLPKSTFTPAQNRIISEVAATLPPSSKWKVAPDGSIKFASGTGFSDMLKALDDDIAATQQRLDAARAMPKPEKLTAVQKPVDTVIFTKVQAGEFASNTGVRIVKNPDTASFHKWIIVGRDGQRIGEHGYRVAQDAKDAITKGHAADVERYAEYSAKVAAAPVGATPAQQAAAEATRLRNLTKARNSLEDAGKWASHQKALSAKAKTHTVQFRANAESPWVDWVGPVPYAGGVGKGSVEFRAVPKGKAGQPKRIQIDAWGPELDLTDSAVVDGVIAKFGDRLDAKTIGEARAGDRAAQKRLSDVLAQEGYYRLRLPEGSQWNGEHVLIHPEGIGERAYARHLKEQVEAVVRAEINPNVAIPLLKDRRLIRKANKGMVDRKAAQSMGASLEPQYLSSSLTPGQVLQRGGYQKLLDEAIAQHQMLRNQQAAVDAAYLARRAKTHKLAKRRGISEKEWKIGSRYKGYHRTQDLLHGPNGGAYAQVTSGDLTQTMVYGTSAHQADLLNDMSRAMMQPEEIHPGDPRYFEALSNLMGRHLRDTPGAVGPEGLTLRDVDPVISRALQGGDRQRLLDETIDWAINTPEGRNWLEGMGLRSAPTVKAAKRAAAIAEKRRGLPQPEGKVWTLEERRQIHRRQWSEKLNEALPVNEVEVADVIRAQFNFVENFMPTQRVRDLFLSGQATPENLRAAFDEQPWRLQAFNGLVSPTHPAYRRAMRQRRSNEDSMGRISERLIPILGEALQKIGSGPETRLARHPVYLAIGKADLQQRVTYAEATLGRELNMDEFLRAREASQRFALKKMEETLYTMKSRSSVDDFMRFAMPFFPAWRNAVGRWGKFYATNPGGVARVARLYNSAFGDMPFYDSSTGKEVDAEDVDPKEAYTLLPGVGSWIPGWKDDPAMREAMRRTKISPRSIDVIFQGDAFNPGFGPWIAAPLQAIIERKAEVYNSPVGKEVAKWFLPMGPQNTGNAGLDAVFTFLPSALKPIAQKTFNTQSYISTRNRVASTYVANGYGEGKTPEQMDEEIDNATMKVLGIKTLMYVVSPVSAQQVGDHEFYAGQFRSLLETQPDSRTAEEVFLERFGSDRWLYTRSSTANLTGGMSTGAVVANQKAMGEINELATTVYNDPRLLGFFENLGEDGELMPYDPEEYNPYARNWQMKNAPGSSDTPYRGTKNYADLHRDSQVALGWRYYDHGMELLDMQLQGEGFTPGTPQFVKERAARSSNVAARVAAANPEWEAARQKVDSGKTERNADFFREVFTSTEYGKKLQGTAVGQSIVGYLTDREAVRAEIARRYQSGAKGVAKSLNSVANEDLAAWLTTRREFYAQGSNSFKEWANQFFRNDNVIYEEAS